MNEEIENFRPAETWAIVENQEVKTEIIVNDDGIEYDRKWDGEVRRMCFAKNTWEIWGSHLDYKGYCL